MKKKLVVTRYIDMDTGEYQEKKKIIDNVYQNKDFVMNYRKKKFTIEQDGLLPDTISPAFNGYFYRLLPFLNANNMLEVGDRPLTRQDLINSLGISKNTVTKFVKTMKEIEAIKQIRYHGEKWFVVNPAMANFGKRVSYISYKVFYDYMVNHNIFVPMDLSKYDKEFEVI